ncbi:N-acetylmuramoyl-L-alanine amidase [Vibrio astriarenae]|uniref:N-acetylmuramoyl-L-alanine amidase n=1 Tax=Vibrio astriarenae TaxID=1481923 RepID=UPI0037366C61
MMSKRYPQWITIHCSATPASRDIDARDIRRWHQSRGWSDIGYHYVITRNGTLQTGRTLNKPGAHVKGHNRGNIGICLVGGVNESLTPEDNFTLAQRKTLFALIENLQTLFKIPDHQVKRHQDWDDKKACPCIHIDYSLG